MVFMGVCFAVKPVNADVPPLPGDIVPLSIDYTGTLIDGNVESLYQADEEDELVLKSKFQGFIWGSHWIILEMYFENLNCHTLKLNFHDTVNTVTVRVYYTDESSDPWTGQQDGAHIYYIDSSKQIDYAYIQLMVIGLWYQVQYLYVDFCTATPESLPP